MGFCIGIDFDNTLVDYGEVWRPAARSLAIELGACRGKEEIRALLRAGGEEGEIRWQRLQAMVYGPALAKARPMAGVLPFLRHCREKGHRVFIVSHKGRRAAQALPVADSGDGVAEVRPDLPAAAFAWLTANDFFATGLLRREQVFFEPERAAKIARIRALSCTHFVDDLAETFLDPHFPAATQKLLLTGQTAALAPSCGVVFCASWKQILLRLSGEDDA